MGKYVIEGVELLWSFISVVLCIEEIGPKQRGLWLCSLLCARALQGIPCLQTATMDLSAMGLIGCKCLLLPRCSFIYVMRKDNP